MPDPPADHDHRLQHLEERVAFAEHAAEQLSGELARAWTMLQRLTERVETLERRARKADADEPDATDPMERPPHSAPSPTAGANDPRTSGPRA